MRFALALAAAMLFASPPVSAACHHFRIWHYPTPQRCDVRHSPQIARRTPSVAGAQVNAPPAPSFDITVPPSLDDAALQQEIERKRASQ